MILNPLTRSPGRATGPDSARLFLVLVWYGVGVALWLLGFWLLLAEGKRLACLSLALLGLLAVALGRTSRHLEAAPHPPDPSE